ncbi:SpoIIE family protein phosphatase [Candidatus Peregrinibacteria bacterium]|nr:SpoIIE family protein phosphatase [Candidatus Peregrinibacteria bacterium]
MKVSIRSKLILAISLLIVVVFMFAAWLFINEKKTEMADDIYLNTLSFAKLTAPTVAYNYDLYLAQNSFVYFNREMRTVFEQNSDVSKIKVVSYDGNVLYDSGVDTDKKYEGTPRIIDDQNTLKQIKSENVSLKTSDERQVFLKENGDKYNYVDALEKAVESLKPGTLIDYFVVPANEKYSIVYYVDYHNLYDRVDVMVKRMIYLAVFGIMLGMVMSFLMSLQITKPVFKLVAGAENLAKGDFKTRVDLKSTDEIGFLGQTFNKMASDLEASVEAKIYKDRVTHELELAVKIQDQLIPDDAEIPKVKDLDIAAGLIPAEEVGGDVYDFIKIEDRKLIMYLGDVTGHGVAAGIISSITNALFYGYSSEEDLSKVMINVNRVLKAKTMPTMFVTLCLMEWDIVNKAFHYVSAGHEQLVHFSSGAGSSVLTPAGGVALGMLPDVSKHIKVENVDFKAGDFIVVYSDGIPEMWKNEKEAYGVERLRKFIEDYAKSGGEKTAAQMKAAILKDVKDFAGGYKQMDDVTLMVMKRTS